MALYKFCLIVIIIVIIIMIYRCLNAAAPQ